MMRPLSVRTMPPVPQMPLLLVLTVALCSTLFTPSLVAANEIGTASDGRTSLANNRAGAVEVLAFRPRRALDILESDDFGGLRKRALDLMDGDGFSGFEKRALDTLDGDDFVGLKKRKRALNALEGDGFGGLEKRALDILDGDDFAGLSKRSGGRAFVLGRHLRARRALDALEGNSFGF